VQSSVFFTYTPDCTVLFGTLLFECLHPILQLIHILDDICFIWLQEHSKLYFWKKILTDLGYRFIVFAANGRSGFFKTGIFIQNLGAAIKVRAFSKLEFSSRTLSQPSGTVCTLQGKQCWKRCIKVRAFPRLEFSSRTLSQP
jgi:hypothetical protein